LASKKSKKKKVSSDTFGFQKSKKKKKDGPRVAEESQLPWDKGAVCSMRINSM
jgi:hypothetical protein